MLRGFYLHRFYESFPEGFLVAKKLQKIIGFIIGIKIDSKTAKILMLSVHKNYRKQGIGSFLTSRLLDEMLSQDIRDVTLEVGIKNTIAINFYKKHGFKLTDTVSKFYQNGEDAYIMKRVLRSD